MARFSYALRIQPITGQAVEEFLCGVELENPRTLFESEKRTFPKSADQAWDGAVAVVAEGNFWLVEEKELLLQSDDGGQ